MYVHVNKINGKKYVGITGTSISRRWRNGFGYKPYKSNSKHHFWFAIQKYGWDNFKHIIVKENLSKNEASIYEQCLISYYKTQNQIYGYNFYSGGETGSLGVKMPEYANAKRSGKNNHMSKAVVCLNNGKIYESVRQAAIDKGFKTCGEISKCCNGKSQYGGIIDGVYIKWAWLKDYEKMDEEEIKNKINLKIIKTNSKSVICLNNLLIFSSVSEAARYAGLQQTSGITKCCTGVRKYAGHDPKTMEQLVWAYYDDYINSPERYNIQKKKYNIHGRERQVVCLNTLQVFFSMKDASTYTTLKSEDGLYASCKSEGRFCGRSLTTNEPLYWKYYDEYENLTDIEKQELRAKYYTGSFLLQQNKEKEETA